VGEEVNNLRTTDKLFGGMGRKLHSFPEESKNDRGEKSWASIRDLERTTKEISRKKRENSPPDIDDNHRRRSVELTYGIVASAARSISGGSFCEKMVLGLHGTSSVQQEGEKR